MQLESHKERKEKWGRQITWKNNDQKFLKLVERRIFTDSRCSVKLKQEKYEENHIQAHYIQTTTNERFFKNCF